MVLLAFSGYPLFLISQEEILNHRASRYEVHPVDGALQSIFHGHTILLSDDVRAAQATQDDRVVGPVRVLIDGRDYSSGSPVEIRPAAHDANRYWLWLRLATLTDRKLRANSFVIVQRLDDSFDQSIDYRRRMQNWRFRLLFLGEDGSVREERFAFPERSSPLYRTVLAGLAVPTLIGYRSDILAGWPSLLFPILYPFLSGLMGSVLAAVGAISVLGMRIHRGWLIALAIGIMSAICFLVF